MVSAGLKESVLSLIRLSMSTARPSSMSVTLSAAAAVGGGAKGEGDGGGGAGFEQPTAIPRAKNGKSAARVYRFMALSPRKGLLGDAQRLARVDQVGILDEVLVGLVDLAPLLAVAVSPLRDLGEAVTLHHDIS